MSRLWKKFERDVATKLTDWSGVKLMRTAQPGIWSTGSTADVIEEPNAGHFPFCVEVKLNEDFNFDSVLRGGYQMYEDWVLQAHTQALAKMRQYNLPYIPLLIFRKRRFPAYVSMSAYDYTTLRIGMAVPGSVTVYARVKTPVVAHMIFKFDDLLSTDYPDILEKIQTHLKYKYKECVKRESLIQVKSSRG